jgi:hypothetical protein
MLNHDICQKCVCMRRSSDLYKELEEDYNFKLCWRNGFCYCVPSRKKIAIDENPLPECLYILEHLMAAQNVS